MAAPVERIADSLDEHAEEPERGGGGRLDKAVKGEFGEYDFDDAQLKVRLEEFGIRKGDGFRRVGLRRSVSAAACFMW